MTIRLDQIPVDDWDALNRAVDTLRALVLDTGGKSLGLRVGVGSGTWTASNLAADATVLHGLGRVPVAAGAWPINVTGIGWSVMSWNATNIVVRGFGTSGSSFSGTFNFAWAAIG